jgi:hypothetical protein
MRPAAFGFVCWLGIVGAAMAGAVALWVIEPLFLLAPLVLVPLALEILDEPPFLRLIQPGCAILAAVSFLVRRGWLAGVLALAWLGFTALVGLRGVARLIAHGLSAPEVAIATGFGLLPVGGVWLLLSRAGLAPMGFEEPTVLLTAVHFHFAAFTALVLTGVAGRQLAGSRLFPVLAAGAIAGTPLLASGYVLASLLLEFLGATTLVISFGVLGLVMLTGVRTWVTRASARWLLRVSAVSVVLAMTLALVYAWGRFSGMPIVALSLVARVHGPLNALGFGACGLLGWALERRAS